MNYAEAFKDIATCDLSDACDALGIAAVTTGKIQPVYPNCPKICGPAVTYRLKVGANGSVVMGTLEGIREAAPGSILVFDSSGYEDQNAWGSIAMTAARAYHMAGTIVEGSTRDVQTYREANFPTYAKGTVVVSVRERIGLESINRPITLAGETIHPGWIIAADENGVIAFPPEREQEVFQKAWQVASLERRIMREIQEGADIIEIHEKMGYNAAWNEQLKD